MNETDILFKVKNLADTPMLELRKRFVEARANYIQKFGGYKIPGNRANMMSRGEIMYQWLEMMFLEVKIEEKELRRDPKPATQVNNRETK